MVGRTWRGLHSAIERIRCKVDWNADCRSRTVTTCLLVFGVVAKLSTVRPYDGSRLKAGSVEHWFGRKLIQATGCRGLRTPSSTN